MKNLKTFLLTTLLIVALGTTAVGQMTLLDDFADGNYTANPVWTVQSGSWTVDGGWLKNTATAASISTPFTLVCNAWQFDMDLEYTSGAYVRYFFLMTSDHADPRNSTADGYYVYFDGPNGDFLLRRLDNGTATTLITYDGPVTTSPVTVKVTRTSAGVFQLFTGGTLRGTSAADITYSSAACAYQGVWITASLATDNHGVDNIYYGLATPGLWNGNVSTSWSGVNNWDDWKVATSTVDVSIPAGSTRWPVIDATANCRNLTIASGATLTSGAFTLNVHGNWSNSGTFTAGTSTINMNGTSVQTMSGVSTFNNLTVNNSAGVTLATGQTVNDTLTLTSGKITLGSNNLTLGASAEISGQSLEKYIVTDGTGVLIRNSVGTTDVLFPVGISTTYNPVTIKNDGTVDNFSVRVQSTFDNAPVNPSKVVNRQWTITEETPGGSNATLTFQWNSGDEAGVFDRTAGIEIGRYTGTQWVGSGAIYLGGSDPYSTYAGGFTSFSDFGVGNSGALPIQIASFTAIINPNGSGVLLEWETISEVNNYGFYVERRAESESAYGGFVEIPNSFVPGAGTTLEPQYYSYVDNTLTEAGVYEYRLRQVDNDGLTNYSQPVSINVSTLSVRELAPIEFRVHQNYPNPFNPSTIINYQLAIDNYTTLKVYNLIGKEVATLVSGYQTAGSHQVTFDGSQLTSGMYFYKLQSGSNVELRKLMLMK
ncbi:MAG: T9SS type A sorting domain-containing protein [Bacteroidota bacterium]|nr:T9SS type A sorting domain-containing protein [Bacteroidota bacterium]